MGRPYEFDREETLSKAMELFWEKGYKATSIEDLVDRMGIRRGSIYNTFGDKHYLIIAAVEYYAKEVTSRTIKILKYPGSRLERIKLLSETIVNTPSDKQMSVCIIRNTAVDKYPHTDKDVMTL